MKAKALKSEESSKFGVALKKNWRSVKMKLYCCDSHEELQNLEKKDDRDYLVATSKYEFYISIKEQVNYAVFLESFEANPYDIVWGILDKVHNVIEETCKNESSHLFHFRYSLEEEVTSKINRLIINLNLIHGIVQKNGISEIYLYDNKDNWVINESIALYAESRQMRCHILDGNGNETADCLKTLQFMGKDMEDFAQSRLVWEEQKKVEHILSKACKNTKCKPVEKDEIGILYCCKTPYNKHVEWTSRRIEAIGGEVRVICYFDTEDIGKFNDKGIETDCMEDFFVTEEFWDEWQATKKVRKEILNAEERQFQSEYLQVDLSAYIVLKMRNYYYREIINRVYMNVCAKNYFSKHEFGYINAWANTGFWETRICYFNTRKNGTKLFGMDMASFIKVRCKYPYQNMLSAVFCPNKNALDIIYPNGYSGEVCFIPDMIWGEKANKTMISKSKHKRKTIGIFPTGVFSGCTTFFFYYNAWIPLFEKFLEKGFEIVFKNHPGLYDCWEENVKERFNDIENFQYHDAFEAITEVLEPCDVILTDISSVVLDAAMMQKVAACFVDSQLYEQVSQHEGALLIYRDMEDIVENISLILENEDRYREIVEAQNKYFLEFTGGNNTFENEKIRSFLNRLK